jgi:TPR repeat protein
MHSTVIKQNKTKNIFQVMNDEEKEAERLCILAGLDKLFKTKEGHVLYTQAAAHGHPMALAQLGRACFFGKSNGYVVNGNSLKAEAFCLKALKSLWPTDLGEQGKRSALHTLGNIALERKDKPEAIRWFLQGVAKGCPWQMWSGRQAVPREGRDRKSKGPV